MGSPMVFQTAPPQPASKARMICSPQLVGGPEASQNGFGEWMPAKLVVRSAMVHSDVGQVVNRPPARSAGALRRSFQAPQKGRLPVDRRLTTCPTRHGAPS